MNTKRLLKIKEQIEDAKTKQSELTGQIKTIKKQMQTEFNVDTVDEAEKLLKKMDKELTTMEGEFKKRIKKLEDSHDWD